MILGVSCGGLAILAAVVLLLNASLSTIADKSNEMETERTRELVNASIQALENRLTGIATDNALWDDAVPRVYQTPVDTNWLARNWGASAGDDRPYDGAFVLDESFHRLWGVLHQNKMGPGTTELLGDGFNTLIQRNRRELADGSKIVSGVTQTESGPAIVTIALIRSYRAVRPAGNAPRRYLVFTRHLTPPTVAAMGDTFKLNDLHIHVPEEGTHNEATLPLLEANGAVIGELAWTQRLTGAVASNAAHAEIQQITLLVGGLVLALVLVSGYGLHRLARSEEAAQLTALTDSLSGLPNRRALYERLQEISRRREAVPVSIVFMDLDGFKEVNDIYGHIVGDQIISKMAEVLKSYMPRDAMLSRIGGDEFAMLVIGGASGNQSRQFGKRVLTSLKNPVRIGERAIQVGVSIGIASDDLKDVAVEEMFRRADVAMYHAKVSGKNQIISYNRDLDAERLRIQEIELGIREGLKRDEFEVVYQPIVDAKTYAVTAVEALVRWPRRPDGPLFPHEFIPIAEDSGLIEDLGMYVLKRACQQLLPHTPMKLSVNISPAQFRDPDFEARVVEILHETDFDAARLELEVTEGYLVENPERAITAITQLKKHGVTFALDDFGTGYSSIGSLRRFKFDRIKIDRSLAGDIDRESQAAALVAGAVNIAQAMSIEVTAEGVENFAQARLLKIAGCNSLQGYYFAKPMPLEELLGTDNSGLGPSKVNPDEVDPYGAAGPRSRNARRPGPNARKVAV